MKHFAWRWLAVSSLLLAALTADAETRPQYGGTLHIAMREAWNSLDPAETTPADSITEANIFALVFEPLVALDDRGLAQAALAISWQPSHANRQWRFRLRPGVKFHDGTPLTPEIVAASLRISNPSWKVMADAESLTIDCESPDPEMLAELALPRNTIANRSPGAPPTGTGPFRLANWQSGKELTFAANDDYWNRRPFVDSIEIEMGKSFRDQLIELQSGKADVVEVAPEQAQRVAIDRQRLYSSLPIELMALVFTRGAQSEDDQLLRQALSLSIDRDSMGSVLLQGAAHPAGSVLPNWTTGYAFVFPSQSDLPQARRDRDQAHANPTWTLGYDGSDAMARLLAERIALNARDAGLSLQPTSSATVDLRLMRIPLPSPDPWIALDSVSTLAGLPVAHGPDDSIENLYTTEQSLLATDRIIPLFHLPVVYAVSPALHGWKLHEDGGWNLADVWLENRP